MHCFHYACLNTWCNNKQTCECPICRAVLQTQLPPTPPPLTPTTRRARTIRRSSEVPDPATHIHEFSNAQLRRYLQNS